MQITKKEAAAMRAQGYCPDQWSRDMLCINIAIGAAIVALLLSTVFGAILFSN